MRADGRLIFLIYSAAVSKRLSGPLTALFLVRTGSPPPSSYLQTNVTAETDCQDY